MKAFLGVVVTGTISDRVKYKEALADITHSCAALAQNTILQSSEHFLSLRSAAGEFHLPRECFMLNTCFYRLTRVKDSELEFDELAQCIVEALSILRENFPSKVHLVADGGDNPVLALLVRRLQSAEKDFERRLLSCLKARCCCSQPVRKEEVPDLLYCIKTCKSTKVREQAVALLLSQTCPTSVLGQLLQSDLAFLQGLARAEGGKGVALLLDKAGRAGEFQPQQSRKSGIGCSRSICEQSFSKFDQPSQAKSFTFQLRESSSIERVTFLLDAVVARGKDQLAELQGAGLDSSLLSVLKNYCEGKYGIDSSQLTKYLVFHNRVLKLLLLLPPQPFGLPLVSQIIEEGFINLLENKLANDSTLLDQVDCFLDTAASVVAKYKQKAKPRQSKKINKALLQILANYRDCDQLQPLSVWATQI